VLSVCLFLVRRTHVLCEIHAFVSSKKESKDDFDP